MTSAPTQVSDDDAKEAYLKRCMDMTHGQLYAELMRVHREATILVQQAVEQEKKECAKLASNRVADTKNDRDYEIHRHTCQLIADDIRARGNDGNNT